MSVTLFACDACGLTCFPARQLCHRCGGADWTPLVVASGVVEETTTVLHQTDSRQAGPCHLASVRVMGAVVMLARMGPPTRPGQVVTLHTAESGAVLGLPA